MKTSNKLIAAFIIAFFLGAIAVHGVLYSGYRLGHFTTAADIHEEDFVRYKLPAPRVIAIDGALWVNLLHASNFALELPRKNEDPDAGMFQSAPTVKIKGVHAGKPAISYEQRGDTLFITGNVLIPIHRPWSNWIYRRQLPQVNIYSAAPAEILLNHGQLYLQGAAVPGTHPPTRVTARNSTLWVGMQYDNRRGPAEYFDSLDIQSANSIIVLNTSATINHLQADLQDSSTVIDQYARFTHPVIRCSPDSRVELAGDALKDNQIIIR